HGGGDVVWAVVDREECHLSRRDESEDRMREANALEVAFRPVIERGPHAGVHSLPALEQLLPSAVAFVAGQYFTGWHVATARAGTCAQASVVVVDECLEATRWLPWPTETQSQEPAVDTESARDRAQRSVDVDEVFRGCPGVALAQYEFLG